MWGLMTVWAEAKYTFPHFDNRPDLDWDRTVREYIPRVIAAQDMDAYYDVLFELVALLKDGHTDIKAPWGHLKPGYDLVPIELHAGGRATLVGQTTGGSAGNGLRSSLPGGGTLSIATFTALIPGGDEYVGVGVTPDVEVWPTREDLAAGRDVVLERAVELLGN